jgi:signal transduction histidine kinase
MSTNEEQDLIAELKRTKLAYYRAKEMSEFKAGFLARVSHELRSPLNSLISLQQLILSELCENKEEERHFISQSYNSGLKLLRLLDELVLISKVEEGREKFESLPVSLIDTLTQVYNITRLQAANKGLKLMIDIPSTDVYVLGDPLRLRQVLCSITDLAITSTMTGNIEISTKFDEKIKKIQIAVEGNFPAEFNCEPIDLLTTEITEKSPEVRLSEGMKLLVNQTVMELMQGRLEMVTGSLPDRSRMQCSLPMANLETFFERDDT